jgi:dipeptidyl-peptidase-4
MESSTSTTAHVPVEVYQRAEELMGPNLEAKVFNVFVVPHWIGDADEFWYDRELAGGHEFVLVDSATGSKRPAFDHGAVATALAKATGTKHRADDLPFVYFIFGSDRESIVFLLEETVYYCGVTSGSCTTRDLSSAGPDLIRDPYFRNAVQEHSEGVLLSPDGRMGVETRSDNNLWAVDVATGQSRPLTDDGANDVGWGMYPDNRADYVPRRYSKKLSPPVDTRWAPDNRQVLVPLIDQRHVEPYPFIESVRKDGSFRPKIHPVRIPLVGERPATLVWYLIDTATGERRLVDLPYEKLLVLQQDLSAVRATWWNQDSSRLYMAAHGDNMASAFLFEVDTGTGAVRTVIEEHLLPRMDLNSTSYNPVNVRVIRDGAEALWWSQRDGWGHLYRYDLATGEQLNQITRGDWLVREIIDVDEDRRFVFFTAGGSRPGNPYYRHVYRVNLDGSDLTLLTPEDADHLLLPSDDWVLSLDGITPYPPISPSGEYVAYNFSRVDQPTRFAIRRTDTGELVAKVEEADASGLYEAGWRPPEEFMVLAPDGETELWGTIYNPSDFDPGKTYPVIDAQYASPLTAITARHFYQAYRGMQPLSPSSYAELGFIVVSLDARGTTHRSADFGLYGYGELHLIGLGDHIHAIERLAEDRPWMDTELVGITGHSYGGYAAITAMLEFPEFFKVGVSSAGVADAQAMYSDYHWTAYHGKPGFSTATEWTGNDPTEIAANWQNVTASLKADRLEGKLLIQFGELDENVPPAQLLQFIDALIAHNKDFDMLYLPNRDHQFIGEGYVMRRDWDYMVRHLAGKEPPREYELKVNRR